MITLNQIEMAQKNWADGIIKIGSLKNNYMLCKEFTSSFLMRTYNFGNEKILFKPTKASDEQFRPTFDMALSYFIGGEDSFCDEYSFGYKLIESKLYIDLHHSSLPFSK